jgi:Bifunctional DNA primase/polymerase, N-terminal
MTIPIGSDITTAAVETARGLTRLGVPVFTARLTPKGDPIPPRGWQGARPDPAVLDFLQSGDTLCAVAGRVFDVLDVDPRNGGRESARRLQAELGEHKPNVYGRASTPSGGWHIWIAALGIGKRAGFYPGLDLQGSRLDGTGRSFVFIPPTVRPSKVDGVRRPYVWHVPPAVMPVGDRSGEHLAEIIRAARGRVPTQPSRSPGWEMTRCGVAPFVRFVARLKEGERNEGLFWACCRAIEADCEEGLPLLVRAAACAGLPEPEAWATVRSAQRRVTL